MTTRRAVAQALSLRTFAAAFLIAVFANAQVEQGRFVGRIVDSQDAAFLNVRNGRQHRYQYCSDGAYRRRWDFVISSVTTSWMHATISH